MTSYGQHALRWLDDDCNINISSCTCTQCSNTRLDDKKWKRWRSLVFIMCMSVLIRLLIASHSYSGYHKPPMFGDYEAQRHWLEVTVNVPVSQWYTYDLEYWGLDYPPLTAYHSWFIGTIARVWEPDMVAFETSRGYETPSSKLFMRWSVVLSDLLVWFPASYMFATSYYARSCVYVQRMCFLVLLLCPPLLLIDHGHFQYNGVTLGLFLGTVSLLVHPKSQLRHQIVASILFCCSIFFKQMSLYYAPAIFVYMLSRCIHDTQTYQQASVRVAILGVTVLTTVLSVFVPLLWHSSDYVATVRQVIHRMFPFQRGLYEDKVANVWCSLSIVPHPLFKLGSWVERSLMVRICTLCVLLGCVPSAIRVLRRRPSRQEFMLCVLSCSLSFFLFGFQVHEKSILMAMVVVTMIAASTPTTSQWCFQLLIISNASMFPLLYRDGLLAPYVCVQVISLCLQHAMSSSMSSRLTRLSTLGLLMIHVVHSTVPLPSRYPDLASYAYTIYGFVHFGLLWMWSCTQSLPTQSPLNEVKKRL